MNNRADGFLGRERTAKALRGAQTSYEREVQKDHVDKFGFKFVASGDERWAAFSVPIRLESHTGVVGKSGSSTFLRLEDPVAAAAAFVEYITEHKWEILEGMAHIIDRTNGPAKEEYIAGLRKEIERLAP